MTNAQIIRSSDVLAILCGWEAEGWIGGILTPAILADKLQDLGYTDERHLKQLRGFSLMPLQTCWIEMFKTALQGIPYELDSYDWAEVFKYAESPDPCPPDSPVNLDSVIREQVETVHFLIEGENDGLDWVVVGKLRDERFFVLRAGCDYTGWDCQAGGSCDVSTTLEDILVMGCTDSERERLGITLS